MTQLVLAALSFAGLHLLVSGTALRGVLVRRLGEGPYRGLFSLLSFVTLFWLGRSYSVAFVTDNRFFWHWPMAQHLAGPVVLLAFLMAVTGLIQKNPTAVGQEGVLAKDPEPRGMQRITRHPFLWGITIWAAFHLGANGDLASIVLFATFLVVAVAGTMSIDHKRAQKLGEVWSGYLERTSNIPFLAIAQGRTRLVLSEIGWKRPLVALVVFGVVVALHPMLFHAYPLPGMAD
jgi:uncharacterized membrane protein